MNNKLFEYLLELKVATSFITMDNSITCYATSEYMLALANGLNYNSQGHVYHLELIKPCTWLLTMSIQL